jgi:hypothetical protein
MNRELVELRREAERAVHDMPEGELKTKAFETILRHLLSGTVGKGVERAGGRNKAQPKQKVAGSKVPKTIRERVLFLKDEGFFGSQKSIAEIRQELKKNGWHHATTALSGPLQSLVQRRLLRRERVADDEQRAGWKYSNP